MPSSPEHSYDHGNILPHTPAEVKNLCHDHIQSAFLEVSYNMSYGERPGPKALSLGHILSDQVFEALHRDDPAAAKAHFEHILQLPGVSFLNIMESAFVIAENDAEYGYSKVHQLLHEERAEAQQSKKQLKLQHWVTQCSLYDIVPYEWINRYATSTETRWKLHMDYVGAKLKDEPDSEIHQTELLQNVDAFLNETEANHTFFIQYLPTILNKTANTELCNRLIAKCKESTPNIQFDEVTFKHFMEIGHIVLNNPDLYSEDTADFFADMIRSTEQRLHDQGTNNYALEKSTLEWKLTEIKHLNAGTNELIDNLNLAAESLIEKYGTTYTIGPDSIDKVRLDMDFLRDKLLKKEALLSASRGDFASAQTLLAVMRDKFSQSRTLQQYFQHVTTLEQFDALAENEALELLLIPSYGIQARCKRALLTKDIDALGQLSEEIASNLDMKFLKTDYITAMHEIIASQDRQKAVITARRVLHILRETRTAVRDTQSLSNYLIAEAGDQEEPILRYQEIMTSNYLEEVQLRNIWELHQLLG